jgi:ribosomal protein L7/L12
MDSWAVVLIVVAAVGAVMLFLGTLVQDRKSASAQLLSIQRKLDLVMDHLDIADAAPERSEVIRHLEAGQPIHAVRAYRRQTGLPLLEAKQAVDRIAAERGLAER